MKAKETAFTFLRTASKYEIPYFQRSYVWGEENWRELLENLLDGDENHFLGSIILKSIPSSSGSIQRWSVIDGQQRLTTLSILFRAAYDSLPFSQYDDETKKTLEADINFLLFNRENKIGAKKEIKILHSMLDADSYKTIIEGSAKDMVDQIVLDSECSKGQNPSSRILQCYKYFYNRLYGNPDDSATVFEFLTGDDNSILVKIDLDSDENEQAIFDTVNSAGVRLTCADTIKNALFQRATDFAFTDSAKNVVIQSYKDNWEKVFLKDEDSIEYWSTERKLGRLKRDNLELLLQSVALIYKFFNPYKNTISDLTNVYRNHIKLLDEKATYTLIKDIAEYAKLYRKYFTPQDSSTRFSCDDPVSRVLHILNVMEISTLHPYILKLLKDYNINGSSTLPQGFVDEIKLLETYVIRHVACNVSVSNFGKVCSLLIDGRTMATEIYEKRKSISDNVVKQKLKDLKQKNKNATLILFWLELYRRYGDKKATQELPYSYTLEHIMPQTWETYWSKRL